MPSCTPNSEISAFHSTQELLFVIKPAPDLHACSQASKQSLRTWSSDCRYAFESPSFPSKESITNLMATYSNISEAQSCHEPILIQSQQIGEAQTQ